jgi:hypothetical protein
MRKTLASAGALLCALILLPLAALAQDVSGVIAELCSDQTGLTGIVAYSLTAIGGASILANFRRVLPGPVVMLLDLAAANWFRIFQFLSRSAIDAAPPASRAAPAILLALALGLAASPTFAMFTSDQAAGMLGHPSTGVTLHYLALALACLVPLAVAIVAIIRGWCLSIAAPLVLAFLLASCAGFFAPTDPTDTRSQQQIVFDDTCWTVKTAEATFTAFNARGAIDAAGVAREQEIAAELDAACAGPLPTDTKQFAAKVVIQAAAILALAAPPAK